MLTYAIRSHPKHGGNGLRSAYNSCAFGRLTRKEDNLNEVRSATPLSRSLSDLIPSSPGASRKPAPDAGILYSFDASSTPREAVGLDSLVEKAEKEFASRETDRIVRHEYEILDESGEVQVVSKGKGKKGSPRQRAKVLASNEDEEDWEEI
jgi:hypothetical protein